MIKFRARRTLKHVITNTKEKKDEFGSYFNIKLTLPVNIATNLSKSQNSSIVQQKSKEAMLNQEIIKHTCVNFPLYAEKFCGSLNYLDAHTLSK